MTAPGRDPDEEWQPPVACHHCGSEEVRFVEPHHEVGIYECERCHTRFEAET